ncbi:MAG: DUF255 domain-containing protein [Desulfobacteraceae bacterium]|nr:DUF255 domain-containing protein [Desulfobacteraceae bacterium]
MLKKTLVFTAVGITCLFSLGLAAGTAFSGSQPKDGKQGINWNSYEAGMKKIKKNNKKGYLHFYTDWCGYCKKMQNETFSDKNVIDSLNTNFVPIKINAEAEPGVAKSFGADRFPFNWFINKEAEPIGSRPGFIPPEMMAHILSYIASDQYKKMQFDEFMEKRKK